MTPITLGNTRDFYIHPMKQKLVNSEIPQMSCTLKRSQTVLMAQIFFHTS